MKFNLTPTNLEQSLRIVSDLASLAPTPYARGIATVALTILNSINESKKVDESLERLSAQILEVSTSCCDAVDQNLVVGDHELSLYVDQLMRALENIMDLLAKPPKRSRFRKVISRSGDAELIKAASDDLDKAVSVFSVHLHFANMKLSENNMERDIERQTAVERSLTQAQKEELRYIDIKLKDNDLKSIKKCFLPQILPAASQIFFGRNLPLADVVKRLLSPSRALVAILGAGGIGKTSLALSAMHHSGTVSIYGAYRYFIACDSANSAVGLIALLSQRFSLPNERPLEHLKQMALGLTERILLCLDNMETSWEPYSTRQEVENVLKMLSDIPNLSLMITLRGSERPYGLQWTRPFLPPLQTLELTAAIQTFVVIAGTAEEDQSLHELLKAVDCLPLAVTLMATQAQYTPCAALLETWRTKKTAMLTRGFDGRLSSLDISIQVSLSCQRLSSNPHALRLLQILSLLPNGFPASEIASILKREVSMNFAESVLQQVALAYCDETQRICVLSPVREYVKANHPVLPEDFLPLFQHYDSLVIRLHDTQNSAHFPQVLRTVGREIGNVHAVVSYALEEDAIVLDAIRATVNTIIYHLKAQTGSIMSLLDQAIVACRRLAMPLLEADCTCAQARVIPPGEGIALFDKALPVYRQLNDKSKLAQCLLYYAQCLRKLSLPQPALKALDEAVGYLDHSTPSDIKASALSQRAYLLFYDGSIKEAAKDAQSALKLLNTETAPYLCASSYLVLSMVYQVRSLFPLATKCARKCLELTGWDYGWHSATFLNTLGDCLFIQCQFQEAFEVQSRAYEILAIYNRRSPLTSIQVNMGRIALAQMDTGRAFVLFTLALQEQQILKAEIMIAHSLESLGELELVQKNYVTAWLHFEGAQRILQKNKHRGETYWLNYSLLMKMGDTLFYTDRRDNALPYYITAILLCRKYSLRLGVGQCLQRLGDFCFATSLEVTDSEDAMACYQTSYILIRDLNVPRHLGDSFQRLAMVNLWKGRTYEAKSAFTSAQKLFASTGDKEGEVYCRQGLNVCDHYHQQMQTGIPKPSCRPATIIAYQ